MIVDLIEALYRLLWGDLFTLPVAGGIGISFMVVLLFAAGIGFTLRTRLLPVRLFRDMIGAVCEKKQAAGGLSSFQTLVISTATRVGMGNLVGVVAAVRRAVRARCSGCGSPRCWALPPPLWSPLWRRNTACRTRCTAAGGAARPTTSMCWPSASGAKSSNAPCAQHCLRCPV